MQMFGHCTNDITSINECSAAARALKLRDTTASDDRQSGVYYDPPYCYYEGGSLKFNSNGKNTGLCRTSDQCLCSLAPTSPPTPAPAVEAEGTCSFESSNSCRLWSNAATGDRFDWSRRSGRTPSSATGPEQAADGRYYMYIETSCPRRPGDKAALKTPPLKVAATTAFSFKYHMYGSSIHSLEVFVGRDKVWEKRGNQGNAWKQATVDLSKYAGMTPELLIVGTRGSSYRGDIAIDGLMLRTGGARSPTAGKA